MSFAALQLPAAAVRYRLDGPPGPHLDVLVAALVGAGATVEPIVAGSTYRVDVDRALAQALAAELVAASSDIVLAVESAPADVLNITTHVAPKHAARRAVVVHGAGIHAAAFVVRAIDAGLTVVTTGVQRWSISGRTAALVAWLAAAWSKPTDEVLVALGLDAATVAAEDDPQPPAPTINVVLPDRRITSLIKRDADGDIVDVTQTETTA